MRSLVGHRGTGPGVAPLLFYCTGHCTTAVLLHRPLYGSLYCTGHCTGPSTAPATVPLPLYCTSHCTTASVLHRLGYTTAPARVHHCPARRHHCPARRPPWLPGLALVLGGSGGQRNRCHCVSQFVHQTKRRYIQN